MFMALERLPGDAPTDSIIAAIRRDGAAIVENFVSQEIVSQVLADLREPFDVVGRSTENDFNGYTTLRVNSVLDLSDASVEVVGHQRMMAVLDAFLLGHAQSYLMGSCTAIEIHPGEQDQALHRDDTIYPVHLPGMELQMSVMWALTDFTEENGATRVVPGSHRWVFPREPGPDDEVVQAPMTPGSALFYLGSAFHGGGANNANTPRAGLVNTYCLGWLRQEVNHILSMPRETAARMPEHIQKMMGYSLHGGMLGYYPTDDGRVPSRDMKGGAMWGWQAD
ncbi:MAG: phytanoyl-CoA dioxygenase [Rhodospirillaceae bacterium]|nr:phytanoyl-CoA dioxygenase [Rhodospirillaceae bacterium]|tara:strand:- start:4133 stop:4972 length:840 start_codon:yes stop_codon:yes gene_type:complete